MWLTYKKFQGSVLAMTTPSRPLIPRGLTPQLPTTTPSTSPLPSTPRRSENAGIAVFSGGTAANSLVDVFDQITTRRKCPLHYIIPISDNGGSSSELIRVFGGPSKSASPQTNWCLVMIVTDLVSGVGDVRSKSSSEEFKGQWTVMRDLQGTDTVVVPSL